MPIVRVNRLAGHSTQQNRRLLDAVHAALVEAFRIPDADRIQILVEHDAASFEIPSDRTTAFTWVEILAFPGRSVEAKRKLYQSIAVRFESEGIDAGDLFVLISEPPLENWSPRDGVSSADAKPNLDLDV
jgi:phenylpyruvate tautomerase PptA (4-oxalocrotonate tautomerase family)